MTAILSNKERILEIEMELSRAFVTLEAASAFQQANPNAGNPWPDIEQRIAQLKAEQKDLETQESQQLAQSLVKAVEELRSIDSDLAQENEKREATEAKLRTLTERPLIQKWLAAPNIALHREWGHSWKLWSDFFGSGRPIAFAPVSETLFFRSLAVEDALYFNWDGDRKQVVDYTLTLGDLTRHRVIIAALNDRRRLLLSKNPELVNARTQAA